MDTNTHHVAAAASPRLNKEDVLVIVNPISGTRSKSNIEDLLEERFAAAGLPYTLHLTTGPDDGRRVAEEAARRGVKLIIAVGGDGTVNEIASALCHTQAVLGIIPCGSGNGLARTLEIPQSADKALDVILGGCVEKCDYGVVNGMPFFCTFGVGFDAAVARKFAGSSRRGKLTYVKHAVEEYLQYQPARYALSLDGEVVVKEAFLIAVCNISQYGNNVYVAPEASVTDGMLDVTVVRAGNPVETTMAGLGMLAGTFGPNRTIESFRVRHAVITRLEPGPVQLDGEPLQMGKRLEVECKAGALKVLVPTMRHKFRPVITPMQAFFSDIGGDLKYILKGGR